MTCGAAGESCCTSPEVTGGTFYRTYTNDGSGPTAEADPATVSSFRLDKYDVTVGRFRQFVSAWERRLEADSGFGQAHPSERRPWIGEQRSHRNLRAGLDCVRHQQCCAYRREPWV